MTLLNKQLADFEAPSRVSTSVHLHKSFCMHGPISTWWMNASFISLQEKPCYKKKIEYWPSKKKQEKEDDTIEQAAS